MSPLSSLSSSSSCSSSSLLIETAHRRRIQADLLKLQDLLDKAPTDPLSNLLRKWHTSFWKAFNTKGAVDLVVEKQFLDLLKEILIDPISRKPLKEEAVLGSEGQTYNLETLQFFQASVEEPFKNRSPLDVESSVPFSFSPHPILREFLLFLNKTTSAPLSQKERIQKIRELTKYRQERSPILQDHNQKFLHIKAAISEVVSLSFQEVQRKIEQSGEALQNEIGDVKQQQEEILAALQNQAEERSSEAQECKERIARLKEKIQQCEKILSDVEYGQKVLECEIESVRRAQKKQESSWSKELLKVVIITGACALGSLALGKIAAELSFAPLASGNGASLTASFAL